jgi:cold shock CspA family protein
MQPNAAHLLAEKVVRELFRIAQAYGKQHPFSFADLLNDLAVMLEYDALQFVALKFFRPDAARGVLAEYTYALHAGAPQFHLDHAQGIGIVPLNPPFEMGLVAQRDLMGGAYRNRLRLNWSDAPHYTRGDGFAHQDGNTATRTGGRASKQVFMDDSLRRPGQVKFFAVARQYGFITGADGVDVFFHAANVSGFQPHTGQRVTFLPLVTPKGIQAQDVRPAAER